MRRKKAGADGPTVAAVDVHPGGIFQPGPDSFEAGSLTLLQELDHPASAVVVNRRSVLGDAARETESSTAVDDFPEAAARCNDRAISVAHEPPQRCCSRRGSAAVAEQSGFK